MALGCPLNFGGAARLKGASDCSSNFIVIRHIEPAPPTAGKIQA
jgi:hypothetical protein